MQTQQINAATGSYFFGIANTGSAEKTVDNTFEQMFQASSEKYDTISVKETKTEVTEAKGTVDAAEKKEVLGNAEESKESVKTEEPVAKAEQPESMDEKELAERAAELVAQVTEVVKDVLGLTEEQLQNTMELLGITEVDLLNTDVLKQMVLSVNGEQDAAAFLMNGDLLTQMQQLLAEVETLIEESGLNLEELAGQFGEAEFLELFENAMDELADTEVKADTQEDVTIEQSETTVTKEAEITFKTETAETKADAANTGETSGNNGNNADVLQEDAGLANQFIQNLQKAFTEGVNDTSLQSDLAAQIREIADQILEQVKMVVTPETTSLEIQLTPEQLGRVNVTVTEQDGVMKATFVTENELAKEAIESNLIQFKQMMNEQGIKVESVEVMVSDFTFDKNGETSQSNQEEKKNNRTRFVMDEETDSVTIQDELARHFFEDGESTVNYMA